ncbi:MAG: elongation factor P [Planctomycetota bacterium]
MYSTSDLKRGLILELDGAPHLVESVQVSTPTARGGNTIHRTRLRNLATRQKVDKSFRGGDTFGVADVDRRPVQLLYRDPDAFHFMDQQTYEQFSLARTDLEWESNFLVDEMEGITALYYNESPLALELPNSVALDITETSPAVKGNSATGRTKPATLQTGHVIQIPEHISEGTRVSVDTRTGDFISRVK